MISRRILVVDDQELILELLSIYLAEEGYEVECAQSGAEALLQFIQGHWSLVITDRMMPGMSGDELATSIRKLDRKTPIVLVSGFTEPGMGLFEFDAILPKPFTKEALVLVVKAACEIASS